MEPPVLHVSEAEAVRDMASILQRVRAGMEVVIERDTEPVAVVRAAAPVRRTISECIALAKAHEARPARPPRSIPTSLPTWKRSFAIANCGTRQRGTDPRFECGHRRRAPGPHRTAEQFQTGYGEIEIDISVVTVVELTHGIQRAKPEEWRRHRQAFVDELIRDVPVHPVTVETAKLAGRIEGEQAEQGVGIAFEDLLIAATALQLGFGVATGNVRHFEHVPGLNIIKG